MIVSRYTRLGAALLAASLALPLSGCDRFRNFTDQEHVQRAKDFQVKGDLRASEIELKSALSKNPNNAEARILLGEVYLIIRRGASAEKEFKRALALGAGQETLKAPLGEAYVQQGQFQRLLDEITPSQQSSTKNTARIQKIRADALAGLGRRKESCEMYRTANVTDPGNVEAYWGLAYCATAARDPALARSHLDQALKLNPKSDGTWVRLGDWERGRGNTQAAEAAYNEAVKLNPRSVEALSSRAVLHVRAGKLDAAAVDAKKLRQSGIEHPGAYYVDALISHAKKQPQQALEGIQKLEKAFPGYVPGWLLASYVHYTAGSPVVAEQQVGRYLAVNPGDLAANQLKALILIRTGRAAEAIKLLEPLVKRHPQNDELHALIGQAYMSAGDYAKASQALETAFSLDPKDVGVQTQLGSSYLGAGMGDQATAMLEAASRADPARVGADTLLVLGYMRSKEYDKALAAVAALEKKQPKNPLAHRMRGAIYLLRNDLPNARRSLEQALAIQPGDLAATMALARLDVQEKKPDAASKRFLGILDKDAKNVDAMLALAQLAAAAKQEDEYVRWLEKAAKANPAALQPRALLVRHYLAKGNPQQALTIAREAQSANPDALAALELLGNVQFAVGEHENAVASFTRLTGKAPGSLVAHIELARAQIALKRHADARTTLNKALALKPGDLSVLIALVGVELADGKTDEALKYARQVVRQEPAGVTGYMLEGDVLMQQEKYAEAVRVYEKAFAMSKSGGRAIRVHQALVGAGRAAEADARLLQWLQEQPNDVAVRSYRAESFIRRQRIPAAIEQYESLLKDAPDNVRALNNLAALYQGQGDARALPTAERAFKLAPSAPSVMDTLGWILLSQGEAKRALDMLKQAAAKAPEARSTRYHYAVALVKTGDRAGGRRELDGLLKAGKPFPEKEAAQALLKTL